MPLGRWGRRLALLGLALFVAAYGLNVYAWLIEPRRLVVRRVTVEGPFWRGAPLSIAVLADTHVGSAHVNVARVEDLVRRINALKPGAVALLGDYASGHEPAGLRTEAERAAVAQGIAAFAKIEAPVFAVIGNHDSWYDAAAITAALKRAGAIVMTNEGVRFPRPEGAVYFAGLADADTGRPDVTHALAREGTLDNVIILSHSPDVFPDVPSRVAVTLAAHTHCGQVLVPFVGRPIVPSRYGARYACGLIREEEKTMVVTGGIGTSILPVRFLTPPEILVVTVKAPARTERTIRLD